MSDNEDNEMEVDAAAAGDEAGTSAAAGSSKPSKGAKSGKRFEIKKWNAVAMWSWAICTDTCAICRNNLYEPSIEYQVRDAGKKWTHALRVCLAVIAMQDPA